MSIRFRQSLFFMALLGFSLASPAESVFLRATQDIFAHPHDVVLDPSNRWLFVADVNHHDIKVLDANTLEVKQSIGDGELNSPHDVHFDDSGRLLVADSGNDRIVIYELNGLNAKVVGELDDNMRSPEGVTSGAGGFIYVASTGNHKILKFHRNRLVKAIGSRGDGKLQFDRPHDIELGADGLLYVGDPGNHRIQVLNDNLGFNRYIEGPGKPFDEPKYLALDDNNWLFVADQHNNSLRIFDSVRNEVEVISSAGGQSLNYIEGVEVKRGMIWISDTYNDRIVLFRRSSP